MKDKIQPELTGKYIRNPATGQEIAEIREHRQEDLGLMVAESRLAAEQWARLAAGEKAACARKAAGWIQANAERIARSISECTGKTLTDSLATEVLPSALAWSYYAKTAVKILRPRKIRGGSLLFANKASILSRMPYGVVGIISPWNYPFGIPVHEVASGLLTGNGVILKVATQVQPVGELIREMIEAAGFPNGLFSLVHLPGAAAGKAFLDSGIGKLFFTGSTEVGKQLMSAAGERLIPINLELGGNDAMIVLSDANLERAAAGAVWAGISNCGQSCAGVERIYVEESVHKDFLRLLNLKIRALRQGPETYDFSVDVGSLTTQDQKQTVERQTAELLAAGASVTSESSLVPGVSADGKSLLSKARVVGFDSNSGSLPKDEIFGPILAVTSVPNAEEAVRRANDSYLGLTASVWSSSRKRAADTARLLEVGAVTINDHLMSHGMAETPWGGFKQSGIGRSHGRLGLEEMTQPKVVVRERLAFLPRNVFWYPHTAEVYRGLKGALDFFFAPGLAAKLRGAVKIGHLFLKRIRPEKTETETSGKLPTEQNRRFLSDKLERPKKSTSPSLEEAAEYQQEAHQMTVEQENEPGMKLASDFIRDIINEDNKSGKHGGAVVTRFPPEPNGYLHIGHAKSICLNFGIARDYNGKCNLRFDDTNPAKEEIEYVDSIMEDVAWLGFKWDGLFYASDYFEQLYAWAELLIEKGLAYVDDSTADEISEMRGAPTMPGKQSPYRERSSAESLDLFRRMRKGEFPDGSKVLRAKIDMSSPNLNMRDPVLYRIRRATHHRTGDTWCIYPMYDYAHGQSDAIEGITHSICTLEFENHRPLYDWFLEALELPHKPRQIEFARLNITYTMMSKRKLLELVQEKHVSGWNDPRMPTISGLRRRGYTPASIRNFAERIGVAKVNSTVDIAFLEFCLREDLNKRARRVMAVLDPLKVIITNYPEGKVETFDADNNPEDPEAGTRPIPFSREIYIEAEDFQEVPPKGFHRLSPGREIRLKHAYYITCTEVRKDPSTGRIQEILCTYDPESRGGSTPDGRKVKGTSHWVSAAHALEAEIRLYDNLFTLENPSDIPDGKDWRDFLNPDSLRVMSSCRVEPALGMAEPGEVFQFLRQGYFCADTENHSTDSLVFNRSVTLKDTWAKIQNKAAR